jgi:hypothetical protein
MASATNFCFTSSLDWLRVFGRSSSPAIWQEFMANFHPYINCTAANARAVCLSILWEREKIVWYGTETALRGYKPNVVNSICLMYSAQSRDDDLMRYFEGLGMYNPTASIIGALRSRSLNLINRTIKKYPAKEVKWPLIFTEAGAVGQSNIIEIVRKYAGNSRLVPHVIYGAALAGNTNIMDEYIDCVPAKHRLRFMNSVLVKASAAGSSASVRWLLSNGANSRAEARQVAIERGRVDVMTVLDGKSPIVKLGDYAEDFDIRDYISDPVYEDSDGDMADSMTGNTEYYLSAKFMANIGGVGAAGDTPPYIIKDDE